MSTFTLDIRGQLNNMRLSDTKALWPLFEAVVNSIHSIEDSANAEKGKISIYAQREEYVQGPLNPKVVWEDLSHLKLQTTELVLTQIIIIHSILHIRH